MKTSWLITFSLLLVSCTSKAIFPLAGSDLGCQPPCWDSITPGLSTINDGRKALVANRGVIADTIRTNLDPRNNMKQVTWEFDNNIAGTMSIKDDLVFAISFYPKPNRSIFWKALNIDMQVDDAIQTYGKPEYLLISRGFDGFGLWAIYSKTGIAFAVSKFSNIFDSKDRLSPKDDLSAIVYFSPGYFSDLLKMGWFDTKDKTTEEIQMNTYDWNGYGTVDDIYPQK